MIDTTSVLDEAFERMAEAGFELPNGFINHGPMACEALVALGLTETVESWARRFARSGGTAITPITPFAFDWEDSLGVYRLLPEWIGYFERVIDEDGWPDVVEVWVPRLLPSLSVALFHGAIRSAHAVRAISTTDTPARRAELARALGYWAARFRLGAPAEEIAVHDEGRGVAQVAAEGARFYLARPTISYLHGVTGAMAVEIFSHYLPPAAVSAGISRIRAEYLVLYRGSDPVIDARPTGVPGRELAQAAGHSGDPHQVKLVEACLRGFEATGDPAFAAAAEAVTGRRNQGI